MSYIGNEPTSVAFLTDTFSGNGSTTAFTLSQAPATTSSIIVAVSGVLQDPSTYSISGTTLTFSGAPPTGSSNISVRFLGIPASGVTTTAYRTVTEFTATSGQTTFSVPSYTAGFIDVYRNGVMLGSADYTATNGTTVVLASGATAGDLVEVISFYVSSVLNAIPATTGSVGESYLASGSVTQAKLATGVAGNGPAFSAYKSSDQTVTDAVTTKITFETEEFDTASCFSSSRFTPTVAGYYYILTSLTHRQSNISDAVLMIYKNGAVFKRGSEWYDPSAMPDNMAMSCECLVYLNGSTDYVEIYIYSDGTGNATEVSGVVTSYFQGFLARAA
jgi:hypothetical protein